jgi:hypothetical protein
MRNHAHNTYDALAHGISFGILWGLIDVFKINYLTFQNNMLL